MSYGALGGGEFTSQNKVLPGSYINVISSRMSSVVMGKRGKAAFPMELDWGNEGIIHLQRDDFMKKALPLFGYPYQAPQLKKIREVFCHAAEIMVGRINGKGDKAKASIGGLTVTARNAGIRGNSIKVSVQKNIDNADSFDVVTYMESQKVDLQTVKVGNELKANDFVSFSGELLEVSAGISLAGGTNSDAAGEDYTAFLELAEREQFNTLGYFGTDEAVKGLFAAFANRLRVSEGIKIQVVLYDMPADTEAVISVKNTHELIPWVVGAEAGADITEDLTNRAYDGEILEIPAAFDFEKEKKAGQFIFYKDNLGYRVLEDINTLVTGSEEKQKEDFGSNKVIRTIDQIAVDTAAIFNLQHLGRTPNTVSGRGRFKEDIIKHRRQLQEKEAIEAFDPDSIMVTLGDNKKSVIVKETLKVTDMMKYLYMTVEVR